MKIYLLLSLPFFFFLIIKKGPDHVQALKFCLYLADKWLKSTTAKVMETSCQIVVKFLQKLQNTSLCILIFGVLGSGVEIVP